MLDEKKIADLKAEHGSKLLLLTVQDVSVVVRPPSRGEYKKFQAEMDDDRKKLGAIENLVTCCIVHPGREELMGLLEKRPGLAASFGSEVIELSGLVRDVEKKEL